MGERHSPQFAVDPTVIQKVESLDAIKVLLHTSNAPQSAVAQKASVTLPQELWNMIITNLSGRSQDELAFLWMSVRNVSRALRAEVERTFKKEHMGKTKLIGDCGYFCCCCNTFCFEQADFEEISLRRESLTAWSHNAYQQLDTIPFDFSRFDQSNPDRAIFAIAKGDQEGAEKAFRGLCYKLGYRDEDPLMRNLKELPAIGQKPSPVPMDEDHPKQAVQIFQLRGAISDCEILDIRLNATTLEISMDWKATLTSFFGRRLAASRTNMLEKDPTWPGAEMLARLRERRENWSRTNWPYDRAKDKFEVTYLQAQVQAWRDKCERTLGEPRLSAEGLRRRRIADLEVNLDDNGLAGPGRNSKRGIGFSLDYFTYSEGWLEKSG